GLSGAASGGALVNFDVSVFARRIATFKAHVADLRYRPARNLRETSFAQDCRFQRELRRQPAAHLRIGRRLAGLVVKNGVAAIGAALDAVGARRENEFGFPERD